jgi:hypothetical protein
MAGVEEDTMRYVFILLGFVAFYVMGLMGIMQRLIAPFMDLVADIALFLEEIGL